MMAKRIKMLLSALCAGFLAFPQSASAAVRTLPNPPPSEYVDGESSICIPIDTSYGPLMRLRLAADFSPTNAVTVDIGTDADNDGNLSPGEVMFRLGVDCGVPFVRKESKSKVEVEQWNLSTYSAGQPEQEGNVLCSTSTSDFAFVLKQPSDVSRRYDLAKVTTHNFTATNLVVRLSRVGTTIFVR